MSTKISKVSIFLIGAILATLSSVSCVDDKCTACNAVAAEIEVGLSNIFPPEIRIFIVQSIIDSVLIREDAPLSVTCELFGLPSFIADLSRKPDLYRHGSDMSADFSTISMTRLIVEICTRHGRVFPNIRGMIGTSS